MKAFQSIRNRCPPEILSMIALDSIPNSFGFSYTKANSIKFGQEDLNKDEFSNRAWLDESKPIKGWHDLPAN